VGGLGGADECCAGAGRYGVERSTRRRHRSPLSVSPVCSEPKSARFARKRSPRTVPAPAKTAQQGDPALVWARKSRPGTAGLNPGCGASIRDPERPSRPSPPSPRCDGSEATGTSLGPSLGSTQLSPHLIRESVESLGRRLGAITVISHDRGLAPEGAQSSSLAASSPQSAAAPAIRGTPGRLHLPSHLASAVSPDGPAVRGQRQSPQAP
jgi:hypothetical protein